MNETLDTSSFMPASTCAYQFGWTVQWKVSRMCIFKQIFVQSNRHEKRSKGWKLEHARSIPYLF